VGVLQCERPRRRRPLNELRGVSDARIRSRKTDPQLDFVQISQIRPFPLPVKLLESGVCASIVTGCGERRWQLDFSVMRFLSAFRNIKTRLLALVALIIVPVALITILLAAAIDQASSSGIESEWRRSTGEYAVRTRIWTKGAARTLSATAASVANLHDESQCGAMLHEILAVNDGHKAIRVDFDERRSCVEGVGRGSQREIALNSQS
jgi:hypothetical protein